MPAKTSEQRQDLPRLDVVPDEGSHPAVLLDRPVCVIGRDYDANLPLEMSQVSRHHALIVRDDSKVYVRDLASKNGTRCNDDVVVEADLHDGDALRIGSFTLRCAHGFDGSNGDGQPHGDADADGDAAAEPIADLRLGGRIVPIPEGRRTFTIGRRQQCDLTIDDPSVSAVHAVIYTMDGRHHVRDLNTQGRTLLNDVPVHQGEVTSGDLLKIGDVTVEYRREDAGAAPAEAGAASEPVEAPAEAESEAVEEAAEASPLDNLDALSALDAPAAEDIAEETPEQALAEMDVPEPGDADSMIPLAEEPAAADLSDESAAGAEPVPVRQRASLSADEPPPGALEAGDSWSGSESAIPFALDGDEDGAASDQPTGDKKKGRDVWKKPDERPAPTPRPSKMRH